MELKENRRDKLLDFRGICTGQPMDKAKWIGLLISVCLFVICYFLPLQQFGEKCGLALGLILSTTTLMVTGTVSFGPASILCVLLSFLFGLEDYATFTGVIGSSPFLQYFGLCVVAYGVESTPFGKRFSYALLRKFGKNPMSVIVIVCLVSVIMSACLSNVAVIIIMGSICTGILTEMGEVKGNSRYGAALILTMCAGATLGGLILPQGAPGNNPLAMSLIETSTGQVMTYSMWGKLGFVCALVMFIPTVLIWTKSTKCDMSLIQVPDQTYYSEKAQELGPISGAEIRWVVYTVALIVLLMLGYNNTIVVLAIALLSLMPIIGTASPGDVFKSLPWEIIIAVLFSVNLAVIFGSSGLVSAFGSLFGGWLNGVHPLLLMMVFALITGILTNVFVNGSVSILTLVVTAVSPIAMGLGLNPILILFPAIIICTQFTMLYTHATMLLGYSFGWWDKNECVKPGIIFLIVESVVFSVVVYLFGPALAGISLYL